MQLKRVRFLIFILLLGVIYLSCGLFDPNDPPSISEVNIEIDDHTVTVSWQGEDTNGEIADYRIALDDSINLESVGTQTSHVYSDVPTHSISLPKMMLEMNPAWPKKILLSMFCP